MNKAIGLLRKHFHAASIEDIERSAQNLFPAFVLGGGGHLVDATNHKEQAARIERVRQLTSDLWQEYKALHPAIRRGAEGDLWERILRINYDLVGSNPQPWSKGADGEPHYPEKGGALDRMLSNLKKTFDMHHKQRDAEFPSKVHLMHYAREVWLDLTGRQAPRSYSEGTKFCLFVADLIKFCDCSWSVDSTIGAWRKFSRDDD